LHVNYVIRILIRFLNIKTGKLHIKIVDYFRSYSRSITGNEWCLILSFLIL